MKAPSRMLGSPVLVLGNPKKPAKPEVFSTTSCEAKLLDLAHHDLELVTLV
jgi:hypothetical protein